MEMNNTELNIDDDTVEKETTQEDTTLKDTSVLGKLFKWMGNSKSRRSFQDKASLPPKYPRDDHIIINGYTPAKVKTEKSRVKKRAVVVPTPRTPDPSTSSKDENQTADGVECEPCKQLLAYRSNTPHPMTTTSETIDLMRENCDRYRMMYLIVRMEQQQDHLRNVVNSIRNLGNKSHYRNIVKIKEAISKLYGTLLSLRDDDAGAYVRIGTTVKDLDDFFNMVENVCSAIEDIPVDGSSQAEKGAHSHPANTSYIEQAIRNPRFVRLSPLLNGPRLYLKERNNLNGIFFQNDSEVSSVETIKTPWPTLNTNDKGRQQKDLELKNLMSEIDELMIEVGLSGTGDEENKTITYEELMSGITTVPEQKHKLKDMKNKEKDCSKSKSQQKDADVFITELDRLLDEADI